MNTANACTSSVGVCRQTADAPHTGIHLHLEFWDAENLDDIPRAELALAEAARECGATLLKSLSHHFEPGGVTALALLSESHIAIHTWPESGYAALDIFTCGSIDPRGAIPALRRAFNPKRWEVSEHRRGIAQAAAQSGVESTSNSNRSFRSAYCASEQAGASSAAGRRRSSAARRFTGIVSQATSSQRSS